MDESGAGDAFAAGFITGLLEEWPLDYILCFASAVGASCTRALGCHDGVSCFDEAQQMISEREHWRKSLVDEALRARQSEPYSFAAIRPE